MFGQKQSDRCGRTPKGIAAGPVVGTVVALLIVAAVAGYFWRARSGGSGGAGGPPPRLNVVIMLIDTLRADRLGCYGYGKPTSPRIDALARESIVFERACSPAPWTLPTVSSLMTSTLPCEHQVLVDGNVLSERQTTLAERLKGVGYATYAFYLNPYAGPISGMHRGFDVSRLTMETGNTDGAHVDAFLQEHPAAPFFFYIHNTEPHNPYHAQETYIKPFGDVAVETRREFRRLSDTYRRLTRFDADRGLPLGTTDNTAEQEASLRGLDELRPQIDILYDATVLEADTRVGSIIDTLKARGVWDDTLFILTADHGEEMGEHGGWQHDQSAYEELIHVPLIVRMPRGAEGGRRIDRVVGLIDVLPTIMDVLQRPALAEGARGRSLLPLIRGESWRAAEEPVVYTTRINRKKYFRPWKESRGDYNVVVRQANWKLILNVERGTVELYDLDGDPGEKVDLSEKEAARAAELRRFGENFVAGCAAAAAGGAGGGAAIDSRSLRQLQNLGYVGGASEEDEDGSGRPTSRPTTRPSSRAASQPAERP